MQKQVNCIFNSCYYQIRNIGLIRKYIYDETCKTLVQALIVSRLNYGNALLYNSPLSLTNRLQRMQNCVARLLTCTREREHITPVLFQLHWLSVRFRSMYKILFQTFNILSGIVPLYVSDLIEICIPVRMLRCESYSLLKLPKLTQQCTELHQLSGYETSC